jgi:hypothetical protein
MTVSTCAVHVRVLTGEVLHHNDNCKGHHDKLNVGNGHAHSLCLLLGMFQHVDILGDAIHQHIVGMHVCTEGDHGMSSM